MPVLWESSLATRMCGVIREPSSITAPTFPLGWRLPESGALITQSSHLASWLRYWPVTQCPHDRPCPFSGASEVVTLSPALLHASCAGTLFSKFPRSLELPPFCICCVLCLKLWIFMFTGPVPSYRQDITASRLLEAHVLLSDVLWPQ